MEKNEVKKTIGSLIVIIFGTFLVGIVIYSVYELVEEILKTIK